MCHHSVLMFVFSRLSPGVSVFFLPSRGSCLLSLRFGSCLSCLVQWGMKELAFRKITLEKDWMTPVRTQPDNRSGSLRLTPGGQSPALTVMSISKEATWAVRVWIFVSSPPPRNPKGTHLRAHLRNPLPSSPWSHPRSPLISVPFSVPKVRQEQGGARVRVCERHGPTVAKVGLL